MEFIGEPAIKLNFERKKILACLTIPTCLKRRCFFYDFNIKCDPGVKYPYDPSNQIGLSLSKMTKLILLDSLLQEVCIDAYFNVYRDQAINA